MTANSETIPVLSIRQPWAWAIVYGGKDIENRSWRTHVRGRVLVHVSGTARKGDFAAFRDLILPRISVEADLAINLAWEKFPRGGIIGSVEIVDCVSESESPWFFGPYGFVLANPKPLPFTPMRGQLGFWHVPRGDFE